jgi:hypothetical protein
MYTYKASKFDLKNINFNFINTGKGKIVNKYNIISMLIENYFIASDKLKGFELARSKQDPNAHIKFGIKVSK